MKKIIFILALSALAGCAEDRCKQIGAVPGTEAYINCVATLQSNGAWQ